MKPIKLFFLGILFAAMQNMFAQQDVTNLLGGANLDDEESEGYWYIEGAEGKYWGTAILQRDTWSARGSRDGSNMTTPFMEYWEDKSNHTSSNGSNMPQGNIRHTQVTDLPAGSYKISMLVRCYAETYSGYAPPAGVTIYANGVESEDVCDVSTLTSYSGGAYTVSSPEIEFEVDESGTLDFGINVKATAAASELSWVAWKNIKLTYLGDGTLQDGSYYVRNRATGLYWQAGGSRGTQLMQGEHGLLINVKKTPDDDGTYYLSSELYNSSSNLSNLGINGSKKIVYMDSSNHQYTIERNEDGFYTIWLSNWGYWGNSSSTGNQVNITLTDPESYDAQWEFIPRNERVQRLLDGTETDATFLISNPRYDVNFSNSNWSGELVLGGQSSEYDNQCAEVWSGNSSTFNVSQTLSNIPNGTYKLSAQGFFRYNDIYENSNTRAIQTHFLGGEQLYAKLYASTSGNEVTTPLQSIASEDDLVDVTINGNSLTINTNNLPFSMAESGRYFQQGYYDENSLTVTVTNHNLTIGIKKEQCVGIDWTIWDNFELELLSLGDNSDYEIGGPIESIPFEEATEDNPVDCTELIANPQFNESGGWTGSLNRSSTTNPINRYGGTGTAKVTFNIYQTLTGLPDGWYRLRAQGFYRHGDVKNEEHNSYGGNNENANNDVWAMYTIPYATLTHKYGTERLQARLYANSFETGLPSIFDWAHPTSTHTGDYQTEFGWVPDSSQGASEAFTDGEYDTELRVAVVGGTMTLGVKKPTYGYKYDWTCIDNFRLEYLGKENLVYATGVNTDATSLTMAVGENREVNAQLIPENASIPTITWQSGNTSVASVSESGLVTAIAAGTTTIYAYSGDGCAIKEIPITVSAADGDPTNLVINEIQVSNLDMFADPSNNYGGYVELYNPSNKAISLRNIYVTDDLTNTTKFRLNTDSGVVPANGFAVVWFDHSSGESGNYRGNVNFKLEMDGGTIAFYNGSTLIASQDYPAAVARTSYARTADGGNTWGVTAYPTPAASNEGSKDILSVGAERAAAPTATPGTGFYNENISPTITGDGTIYCTLDGTVPSEDNGILAEDLPELIPPTVLRLRAFEQGKLPSEVVTYTYAENKYNHSLPVLMITASPDDMYSDDMGIFVTGTKGVSGSGIEYPCNWNLDWDRSANMEYLSSEGESLFRQDVNIARFGGWSRSWIPYNFKIKAQKQYEGKNYLFHQFFMDNKPYLKHKVLQVRNGGNDVNSRIKDAALHNIIITSGFYLDCLDYQPVHCYINGQYYGMENLREPSNKHYALADYGIDTDEVDAMEITGGITLKAGSTDSFYQWQSLSSSASNDDTYNQICELVDVEEFANYMAAQIYLGGDDWPGNNCKGFKGNDGKFHIVFFDVDQALRFDTNSFNRIGSSAPLIKIFKNMMGNSTFRKMFIDSFCLFGGSVMNPERCHEIIDRMSQEMNPALQLEGLSTSPTADYMKQVLTTTRQQTMIDALKSFSYSQLGSTRAYKVKLEANVDVARLLVNGMKVPTDKFDGTLFAPAVLTASAPEGYAFKGWMSGEEEWLGREETFNLAALSDSEALTETFEITAVYEELDNDAALKSSLAMPIKVNEVSAGNTIFACETWKRSDWIELYNNTDTDLDVAGLYLSDDTDQPMKYQIVKKSELCNTIIPARGHLTVWADGLETTDDQTQLHANFKLSNSDDQIVVALSGDAFITNNSEYFNSHPEMQTFIDGLSYSAHRGDETVGRFPDGGKYFYKMGRPTIERKNTLMISDPMTGEDQSLLSLLPDGFSIELAQGWNWMSHCLETPVGVNELPTTTSRIISQTTEAIKTNNTFSGSLKTLSAGNLYKMEMAADDVFSSSRHICDSNLTIPLKAGWTWAGYPISGMQTLDAALTRYLAEEGDMVVGQDGFATYDGTQWTGSLTTLETGKGYMFYTPRAKSLKFKSPEQGVNIRRNRMRNAMSKKYGFDKHAYPNVMGIVGTLQQADTLANDGRYTLLAYCNGECRGAGTWIDGRIFITIYGNDSENINFIAYDEIEGVAYPVVEQFAFESDVKGTLKAPKMFTIEGEDATDIAQVMTGNVPHIMVEGYYNFNGMLMGNSRNSLPRGIYIVRYADGAFGKIYVK